MATAPDLEFRFLATPDKGEVSALLRMPVDAAAVLVLGHGAGAGMRHRNLEAISTGLASRRIGTLRYQFPFMERGGGRDSDAVSVATVTEAVRQATRLAPGLPLFAGGQSFGGRMTSLAVAQSQGGPLEGLTGVVYFNFPLHAPGKPSTRRAMHLAHVQIPQLFVSGTRDPLAQLDLLKPIVHDLGSSAMLHLVDTADHGFKVLKRSRRSTEDPIEEACRVVGDWMGALTGGQ